MGLHMYGAKFFSTASNEHRLCEDKAAKVQIESAWKRPSPMSVTSYYPHSK